MATENTKGTELGQRFIAGEAGAIEQLISEYEQCVFAIGLHLTGNEKAATEVVEEVFVRLYRELPEMECDSIESAVHQLAYEVSLARLLGKIDKHVSEVQELFAGSEESFDPKQTTVLELNETIDYNQDAASLLDLSTMMLNGAGEQATLRKLLL